MENDTIDRSALGRVAELGYLYNARTDRFLGVSALSDKIPPDAITTEDRNHTDIDYVYSEKYSEKMNKIDITPDLKVSFLSNLITIQGSAHYLNDVKSSARTVRSTLVCKIETKTDHLNLYHKEVKTCFSAEALLGNSEATHMVVSIRWGANVFATIEADVNTDSKINTKALEGSISTAVTLLGSNIKGDKTATWSEEQNQYKVKFYGDAVLADTPLPSNLAGAQTFLAAIPKMVAGAKNGKGDQLSYQLVPIGILTKYVGVEVPEVKFVKINIQIINQFVQIFDDLSTANQRLNDLYEDTLRRGDILEPEELETVKNFRDAFVASLDAQREALGDCLVKVRAGSVDPLELGKLRDSMLTGDYSAKKVKKFLRDMPIASLIAELQLLDHLQAQGVISVDNEETINTYITMYDDVFVFYPHEPRTPENQRLNNKELNALLNIVEKNPKNIAGKKMAFLYAPNVPHDKSQCSTFHYKDGVVQTDCLSSGKCIIG